MHRALSHRADLNRKSDNASSPDTGTRPRPTPTLPPSPTALEAARTVGRSNPALADLQRLRAHLTPLQAAAADDIAGFYENSKGPRRNLDLDFSEDAQADGFQTEEQERTLERRASFLLNSDTMDGLATLIGTMPLDAEIPGAAMTMTTAAITAAACSIKSQTEHVKAVALQDARHGDRICPMTLQPAEFQRMLDRNTQTLARVVEACRMPVAEREQALNALLEQLAVAYFQHSLDSPGAPRSAPHKVVISLSEPAMSDVTVSLFKEKIVHLAIDSAGIDHLCTAPLPTTDTCQDQRTIFRAHLLEGFQNHSPEKKRAALYLQLLWRELGIVQETLGLRSADKPRHGAPAQRAAARTHEERSYPGSQCMGDQIGAETDPEAQRRVVMQGLEALPGRDRSFKQCSGLSLITDDRVRAWTHSTAYPFELRMLRRPRERLLLQAIPITGAALLRTSVFRTPK